MSYKLGGYPIDNVDLSPKVIQGEEIFEEEDVVGEEEMNFFPGVQGGEMLQGEEIQEDFVVEHHCGGKHDEEEKEEFTVEGMHCGGKHDEEEKEEFTVEGMHCGGKHDEEEKEEFCGGDKRYHKGGMMCPMKRMKYRIAHMDMKLNLLVILVGLVAVLCLYRCVKK